VYHTNPKRQTPEQRAEEERRYPHGLPDEGPDGPLLRINRLGADGDVLSSRITSKHELRVVPGHYGIAVMEGGAGTSVYVAKKVTVSARQTVEVTLTVMYP
jgi:hypothetical protein